MTSLSIAVSEGDCDNPSKVGNVGADLILHPLSLAWRLHQPFWESHGLRLKLFFRMIRDFAFIFLQISARADTGQLNGPRAGKDPEPFLQVLDVQLLGSDHG